MTTAGGGSVVADLLVNLPPHRSIEASPGARLLETPTLGSLKWRRLPKERIERAIAGVGVSPFVLALSVQTIPGVEPSAMRRGPHRHSSRPPTRARP
jgi:hypothetical protein